MPVRFHGWVFQIFISYVIIQQHCFLCFLGCRIICVSHPVCTLGLHTAQQFSKQLLTTQVALPLLTKGSKLYEQNLFIDRVILRNLNKYFSLHICMCISLRHVCSVCLLVCYTLRFPIPANMSQNSINESYLVCFKSKKYAFCITISPLESMRQG